MGSTSSPTLHLTKLEFSVLYPRKSNKIASYIPFVRTHVSDFMISHKISQTCRFNSNGSAIRSSLNDYSVDNSLSDQTTRNIPELEVQTRMWNWKGFSIRYQYCGNSGPALVLVHGFGANSDHWRKNIPVLAKSHKVYSIDLIGYGYSDKPNPRKFGVNSFYTFETWATQLNEFCSDVVKDEAFFICNSIGGVVGLQAAVMEPQICKGIVVLNISLRMLHIKKQPSYGRPLIRSFQNLLRNTALGKFFFKTVATPQSIRSILCQVERKIELVYGGGSVGLMGLVSQTVHQGGCHVLGIIPAALVPHEISGGAVGETVIVSDMHERKAAMARQSDAFIALPGGYGTMEELLEMITWSQLGIHDKPVGVLNVDGYYDFLLGFFEKGVEEGFIKPTHQNILVAAHSARDLIHKMEEYVPSHDQVAPSQSWNKQEASDMAQNNL